MLGGLGLYFIGVVAFLPKVSFDANNFEVDEVNTGAFYVFMLGGLVLDVWGAYQWWGAAQQLGPLKAKRYDFGASAFVLPKNSKYKNKATIYGLNIKLRF